METIIVRFASFQRGVLKFEALVNEYLADGWTLAEPITIRRAGLFRVVCIAHLYQV